MGAFINYVDVFLDLFVPLFPLYRIEVALINKIAHGALPIESYLDCQQSKKVKKKYFYSDYLL